MTFNTKQNYKGLWEVEVIDSNGSWIVTRTFTTKAKMNAWIKEQEKYQ